MGSGFGVANWLVVLIPLVTIIGTAIYCRRYIRDVADYLSAGRVARRYVICVGGMEEALGVMLLIQYMETHYMTGFSLTFWTITSILIGMFLSLSGWCMYRFRETRSMTLGQFVEIRYNRPLRVFASVLKVAADILTELFLPAVAAHFFIYFFDLPLHYTVFGVTFSTYASLMLLTMSIAMFTIFSGGAVALLVTDCLQGIMCYPMFLIIVLFALYEFDWGTHIVPVMFDRVPGENFMNPFDISKMRDFNVFMLAVNIIKRILQRAVWIGSGSATSAKNAHEQKMAGVLATWRAGFSTLMQVLIAIMLIVMMNHKDAKFSKLADDTRRALSLKAASEVMSKDLQAKFKREIDHIGEQKQNIGVDPQLSKKQNLDTPYFDAAEATLKDAPDSNLAMQNFRTLYIQQLMPVAMRHLLPKWMLGLFILLIVMIMISTDASRIFLISTAMAQDLVLPFLKRPLQPKSQMRLIKMLSIVVAIILFLGSYYITQMEYLSLFVTLVASLWVSGAGWIMCFGLYSRFGTSAGAFAALLNGFVVSVGYMFVFFNWADHIYPWLAAHNMIDGVSKWMHALSAPLNPWIDWKMDATKFPINAFELSLFAILTCGLWYIIVSLCQTLRISFKPFGISWRQDKLFNLDKMLYRGKYADDKSKVITTKWTLRNIFSKLVGISPEYTKFDKGIAYGVFVYTFIYRFLGTFGLVLLLNWISPWGMRGWSIYYYLTTLAIPFVVALISTVWFMWGGINDLRHLFIDLEARKRDFSDDGRVNKD